MAIRIIAEPDIFITQSDMERLWPEWEASQRMTVRPVSFEVWLRMREAGMKGGRVGVAAAKARMAFPKTRSVKRG